MELGFINQVAIIGVLTKLYNDKEQLCVQAGEELIDVKIWKGLADSIGDCEGKLIGIKGKIERNKIVAEKVSVIREKVGSDLVN